MDFVFLESLIWNLNICGAQMVVAALSKLWMDLHGKDWLFLKCFCLYLSGGFAMSKSLYMVCN